MLDAIDAKMEGIMSSEELLELEAYLEQAKALTKQYPQEKETDVVVEEEELVQSLHVVEK